MMLETVVKNVLEKYSVSMMWELIFCEKSLYCMTVAKQRWELVLEEVQSFWIKKNCQDVKLLSLVYNYTEVLKWRAS